MAKLKAFLSNVALASLLPAWFSLQSLYTPFCRHQQSSRQQSFLVCLFVFLFYGDRLNIFQTDKLLKTTAVCGVTSPSVPLAPLVTWKKRAANRAGVLGRPFITSTQTNHAKQPEETTSTDYNTVVTFVALHSRACPDIPPDTQPNGKVGAFPARCTNGSGMAASSPQTWCGGEEQS